MAIAGVENGNLARENFLELLESKALFEHRLEKEDAHDMSQALVSVFLEVFK